MDTPCSIKISSVDSEFINTKSDTFCNIKISGKLVLTDKRSYDFMFVGGNLTLVKDANSEYSLTKEETTRLEQLLKTYIAGMQYAMIVDCQSTYQRSSKIKPELED